MDFEYAYAILLFMRSEGGGFTIVEVMLFLAMSSFLLVVLVSSLDSGRRNAQFSQGVRDAELKLADIINDVPTGYSANSGGISCNTSGPRPVLGVGANSLGTSEDCIYVGKAVRFRQGDDSYYVYSLVGKRETATGEPVDTIDEAAPVSDLSTRQEVKFQWGFTVEKIFNGDTPANEYGSIALMPNLSGASPSNAASVGQAVLIGGIQGTDITDDELTTRGVIDKLTDNTTLDGGFATASKGIIMCLISAEGKKASLTLGASGSGAPKLDIEPYDSRC